MGFEPTQDLLRGKEYTQTAQIFIQNYFHASDFVGVEGLTELKDSIRNYQDKEGDSWITIWL